MGQLSNDTAAMTSDFPAAIDSLPGVEHSQIQRIRQGLR